MTKGGRIFGGVFAIISSGIVLLISYVFWIIAIFTPVYDLNGFYVMLGVGIIGLIGGILLIMDKTAGGALVLIAALGAVLAIFLFVWPWLSTLPSYSQSLLLFLWAIPPIMLFVGGITGTAVGSEGSKSHASRSIPITHLPSPSYTLGPPCPRCRRPARFIPPYQRYYCDRCQEYL